MKTSRRRTDPDVRKILDTLTTQYKAVHAKAKIDVYRYNWASIRIRIIDPDFAGKDRVQREDMVWGIIETLPEDVRQQITVLLLLPPAEVKTSFMNMEFEDPSPSGLL
jgi:stress-induced morphogen